MINKPPPFKGLNIGLNIRILSMIPIKGRGCINQGSTLPKCSYQAQRGVTCACPGSCSLGVYDQER